MTDNDDIAVEGDIVDVLREWVSPDGGYVTVASDLLANAAYEIEELRSLITAWADADDVDNVGWGEHGGEYPSDCSCPYCEAARSLREAVGR